MNNIKLLILDRDGLINQNSSDPESPYYYILNKGDFNLLPNVVEAFSLIKDFSVVTALATKQKCISKGLLTYSELGEIHEYMESLIDFKFDSICIEKEKDSKLDMLSVILYRYRIRDPKHVLFIDDSKYQCEEAAKLGINVIYTNDLYETIKRFKNEE